jgi:tetratricopeptide (TPR) repeat protein
MRLLVGLVAVVAAATVAGVVYATRQDPSQPKAICKRAQAFVVPGVPSAHVAAVRRAFTKDSKEAAVALEPLAQQSPKDAVVAFNDGLALYCAGYLGEATTAFEQAKKYGANTFYRVQADLLLHPQYFQKGGYPPFEYYGHDPLLVQGQVAQRGYHQVTAERLWALAAKRHPNDPDALVAAAVGRFDMDDLSASFSRLGPLAKRFPKSQTVRFHLGLLLVYIGQRKQAIAEFEQAERLGRGTELGKQAARLLAGIEKAGSSGSPR